MRLLHLRRWGAAVGEGRARWTAVLYGDTNLNLIDGSSVWLVSMAECLARAGAEVHVQLKADMRNDRPTSGLERLDAVKVHPAFDEPVKSDQPPKALEADAAARRMADLVERVGANIVVCRGLSACAEAVRYERVASSLWAYVTDVPRRHEPSAAERTALLREVAAGSRRMLAQTEDARSYLEAVAPEAAGKTVLLNPMIPDELVTRRSSERAAAPEAGEPLRMVYSGKFAADWKTLEMVGLPTALEVGGVDSTLTLIGDKVQRNDKDPDWRRRMGETLEGCGEDPRVHWLGGLSREEALTSVASHHVGLCWRSPTLDSSLELSTKLLEYGAAGVAPVLNRTAAHEALLGSDYPFYVDDDITVALERAACDPQLVAMAADRVAQVASQHTIGRTAERLRAYFEATVDVPYPYPVPPGAGPTVDRPLKVLLAGHDFKFAGELLDGLGATHGVQVRIDNWHNLHKHDEEQSRQLLAWADVVLCEFAGRNAVFYSQNKRADQSLVVRFHGFEVRGPWLGEIDVGAVDRVVFVSDAYRREVIAATGWPEERCVVVPNAVDVLDLERPKMPDSPYHLGIVGIVPFLKRPDRAVDLLERLIAEDERFVLHVKGRFPWNYPWVWRKNVQREAYEWVFQRLGSDRLREHVAFDGFSPDMGNWLRRIGFVLSPSTRESFHMAPVEGMASGAVPVVWDRPGVEEIFGNRWIVPGTADAAARILQVVENPTHFEHESLAALQHVRRFDTGVVSDSWRRLLVGAT